ncbi:2050_t:CDS:10 [Paraglomus brasilianum]|uniref:Replication factor C subunit 3 n=1 Tax=Paraglomus brasilianum TaxID=144538 RepID=A0A9N9GGT0_9GLOM|nr:2050_t:CDS:10 [Paraglomus brasilianum]
MTSEPSPPGEDTLPWVEKYRPQTLNDLVSHKEITETIERFIDEGRLPHLLLYGPAGTGKTSTILACARKLYGPQWKSMIMELNASDERGIDVVREQVKTFASTRKIFNTGFKLIILDEADAMTTQAQNALRRIVEKYTQNVRFCIICNYVSKIIPALQSRCTRFRFSPLEMDQVKKRLETVIETEGVNITEDGKQALLTLSNGDMRRALNILQACHAAYDLTDEAAVYNCTGNPLPTDIHYILRTMMKEEFTTAYSKIMRLKTEKGLALQDVIFEVYKDVVKYKLSKKARVYLLEKLAEIEYRLTTGASEKIQVTAMLGAFKTMLDLTGGNADEVMADTDAGDYRFGNIPRTDNVRDSVSSLTLLSRIPSYNNEFPSTRMTESKLPVWVGEGNRKLGID